MSWIRNNEAKVRIEPPTAATAIQSKFADAVTRNRSEAQQIQAKAADDKNRLQSAYSAEAKAKELLETVLSDAWQAELYELAAKGPHSVYQSSATNSEDIAETALASISRYNNSTGKMSIGFHMSPPSWHYLVDKQNPNTDKYSGIIGPNHLNGYKLELEGTPLEIVEKFNNLISPQNQIGGAVITELTRRFEQAKELRAACP
jgi:hypothetical protein